MVAQYLTWLVDEEKLGNGGDDRGGRRALSEYREDIAEADERLVDVGGLLELLLVIDDVGRGALAAHQVDQIYLAHNRHRYVVLAEVVAASVVAAAKNECGFLICLFLYGLAHVDDESNEANEELLTRVLLYEQWRTWWAAGARGSAYSSARR